MKVDARRLIRRAVLGVLAVVVVVLGWYGISRWKAVADPLELVVIGEPEDTERKSSGEEALLRVGAFNIAHGRGGVMGASNWREGGKAELLAHLERIAEQVRRENLDVLVLNECDFRSNWSFGVNQARHLAEQCGFPYVLEQKNIGVSLPFFDLCFGNAVLSRYPIRNEVFLDLPPLSQREDLFFGNHDCAYCEIETPHGPVGVFGIHLEHRDEATRVKALDVILEKCGALQLPVIALGDFNSTLPGFPGAQASVEGANAMENLLNHAGFASYVPPTEHAGRFTFPSAKPERIIDWIAGKRVGGFTNSRRIVSELSDHLMIAAEVKLAAP